MEAVVSRPAATAAGGLTMGITARLTGGDAQAPWLATLGASRGRPLIATQPLPGSWLPMADGARFDVRITADGAVEVDPLNAAADDSLAAR
jgi:hypothetical protein